MVFANNDFPMNLGQRLAHKALRVSAVLAMTAALCQFTASALLVSAGASDLNLSTSGTATDDGQFIRIGLNKSVVIRLPADAMDVIIGNPAIVDAVVRTKNTAYLFARSVGQTNIFFFNAAGQQIMNIDLEVALDMKALQKLIDRTIPGSQITVDTVNESVILGGTAASASEASLAEALASKFAATVVNTIAITGGDQVMLKVRVVEIKRDVLKQLGININSLAFNIGSFALDATFAAPVKGVLASTISSGSTKIGTSLQALENDGLLRTLAEPTLSAVSGQSAKFHAGGEFRAGETCNGTGDSSQCTTLFKEFGVKLDFTPTVLSEGRISLKVRTEVSDLSDVTTGTLDSRSAETTLELPSGGSMMLAGLIKEVNSQKISGTPGLKNLPVLGALFRSRDFTANQTELVVLVTPYIVNPVNPNEFATPDQNLSIPTDRQTILLGRLNRVYGTPGKNPKGVYHGNVGFIVE